MKMRTMVKMLGAVALVAVMTVGSAAAPAPVGANPTDTYLPNNTLSPQYSLGGCLYKVIWGNFGSTPFTQVQFYNLTSCGGAVVALDWTTGTTTTTAFGTTVTATGTDGCGTYQVIQATGGVGFALRGLVWVGTGFVWYANDGLNTQTIHAHC